MTSESGVPLSKQFSRVLVVGRKYRVRFLIDRGRGPLEYEMTAVYLGWRSRYPGKLLDWSGRPAFGTTTMTEEDVVGVWNTEGDVHLPRRRKEPRR